MADYTLSSDGRVVIRTTDTGIVDNSEFPDAMLSGDFTITDTDDITFTFVSQTPGSRNEGDFGSEFIAQATHATLSGQLEWIQVLDTNVPLGGATSPYLDNGGAANSDPFYPLTQANDTALNGATGDVANGIHFYDFSRRTLPSLEANDTVTWNAVLYPVLYNSTNDTIQVGDGYKWGWTAMKATVGETTGIFTNPTPGSATWTGEGTSNFTWGTGLSSPPSSVSFTGRDIDPLPGTPFILGTLSYFNGTINNGSGTDTVTFEYSINFTNVPEENVTETALIQMINTLNTSDPVASADQLFLEEFGISFNVFEDASASADIVAVINTQLDVSQTGPDAESFDPEGGPVQGSYTIQIIGLTNETGDSFVTVDYSLANYLTGTDLADDIEALSGDDFVYGLNGDDTLNGGADDDYLEGNAGSDLLIGEDGDDTFNGGQGFDTIDGGSGNDLGLGKGGADLMEGFGGNDTFNGNEGNDTLSGGADDDVLDGGIGFDSIVGGGGNDSLIGGNGFDTLLGGLGDDTIEGRAGNDYMAGGADDDILRGGIGTDTMLGGAGIDMLYGGNGADWLSGDLDADRLEGNSGFDTLNGGGGDDTLRGGIGIDTFIFEAGSDNDTIMDFANGFDILMLDADLFAETSPVAADAASYVTTGTGGFVMLDFGLDTLTFWNVTNPAAILDQIQII